MLHPLGRNEIIPVENRVGEGHRKPAVPPDAGVERSALCRLRHAAEDTPMVTEILRGGTGGVVVHGSLRQRVPYGQALRRLPRPLSLRRCRVPQPSATDPRVSRMRRHRGRRRQPPCGVGRPVVASCRHVRHLVSGTIDASALYGTVRTAGHGQRRAGGMHMGWKSTRTMDMRAPGRRASIDTKDSMIVKCEMQDAKELQVRPPPHRQKRTGVALWQSASEGRNRSSQHHAHPRRRRSRSRSRARPQPQAVARTQSQAASDPYRPSCPCAFSRLRPANRCSVTAPEGSPKGGPHAVPPQRPNSDRPSLLLI